MAATADVIPENTIRVLDHGFVRLDDAMASDLSVVNGARVSFARRKEDMDGSDEGLIRFLMRDRHGCYDDATEVLTDTGWKAWPDVTGSELFATMTCLGSIVYQPALRLVRKELRGHMIGFKGMSLDLLVTPDHRVLTSGMTTLAGRRNAVFSLRPAHSVLWQSHRHVTTGIWSGRTSEYIRLDGTRIPAKPLLRLIGFFIGDGNLPPRANHIAFNLRKAREITFLYEVAAEAGFTVKKWQSGFAIAIGGELRELIAACYERREKVIPRTLLGLGPDLLLALYDGLLESDGSRHARPGRAERHTYYTTSKRLADDVQELAFKIGRSATVRPHPTRAADGHDGRKPRWRVTIYNERNTRPALCRTRADADNQMGIERYNGVIHCVEVPNGTLYVRRNGYPVWCGNTPFEHNSFRFHVRCPIFVAREWMRHRVGSFNEFSMRYAKATDDFYVPEPEDVRTQVGKPGAYTFEPVDPEIAEQTREELRAVYDAAFETYERLVDLGVARELARCVMPVGAYTEFYWTLNARSLMNFVSLRAAETAQREIRRYADAVEQFFAEKMPVTHAAFVANDRTAP
ncbi:MAG TPA: FAD-dependent thymidylate synthase [Gaiellaceae bacterium]|nr:FAD-dependent thymidylate synthase [Gaiellaceae bacterium]